MLHQHFLFPIFTRAHTALHTARRAGASWHEYLPLLKAANEESRLFDVLRSDLNIAPLLVFFAASGAVK